MEKEASLQGSESIKRWQWKKSELEGSKDMGKKVSEGKARMKKKCCLSTFGSRCCSRVSRVSQQDMRARRGDT